MKITKILNWRYIFLLMTELIHQLNAAHNGLDFIIYVIMPVQFKLLFSGSHRSRLVFFVRACVLERGLLVDEKLPR